jgi:hypothetical protein
MITKKLVSLLMVVIMAVLGTSLVSASVTVDPNTGIGFVGKGDVQTVMGKP